jgi:hypothetical protein
MSEGQTEEFDYATLVADALRGVVRNVLRRVQVDGLLGEQHLYLTFRTASRGLDLPARLRRQFPEEMTIVLQNQFWGLAVEEDAFSVQLKFGGRLERLTVPFAALVAFADPSVPFGLRFEPSGTGGEGDAASPAPAPAEPPVLDPTPEKSAAKVVAFRPGRKKQGPGPRGS